MGIIYPRCWNTFVGVKLTFFKIWWTVDLLIPTCGATFLTEKLILGLCSWEHVSNSQLSTICFDAALTDRPFHFCRSPDRVSLTLLTISYMAILEQLEVESSFQISLAFHPFSRKSFFKTVICSFVKTIFSNYTGNSQTCQYRKWSFCTVYFHDFY